MRVFLAVLILLSMATANPQPATSLQFEDIAGWWSADPEYAGESSRVVLHLLEEQGKPTARLSIVAIGGYDFPLGTVTLTGNSLDSQPFSFPLQYDATRDVLAGFLPKDAVPVYRIPVEFHRSQPYAKPSPPVWPGDARPAIRWSVDTGSPAWAGLEHSGGLIYTANDAGLVHAVDTGGTVRWKFATGQPIKSRPAAIGDSVYIASDSGFLYRLDKLTGIERWRAKVDAGSPARIPASEENSRWDRYGSSVVAGSKHVYFASRDKHLYAFDLASGKEAWRVATDDMMTATPALYRDSVLFADFSGKVQAVSASDGKPRWTYDASLPVAGDLVIAEDRVLIGSRTYELIALDAATGRQQWKHYYWFSWIESPPVVRDGVIYTGSSDATKVFAINLADGTLRWKTAIPGWAWSRTAVTDDLVVAGTAGIGAYPGARSGSLIALDRRTGALRWLYLEPPSKETIDAKQGWGFGASPLVLGDAVYAVDLKGRLYAFEAAASR